MARGAYASNVQPKLSAVLNIRVNDAKPFMLLLDRIKEAYDQGHDNDASVSEGIRLTAGQITSAAAIMVGVFGTFALGRNIDGQQFGLGLGVAVLIDATIIRSALLPASTKLLGDWNSYLPTWLEWLPQVGVSEEPSAIAQSDPEPVFGAVPISDGIGAGD